MWAQMQTSDNPEPAAEALRATTTERKKAAGGLTDPLPPPAPYDRIDKIIIICLIGVFLFLFIWFSKRRDQPLFEFWTFTALLTLIFVGVMRATGIIRTSWIALGGSVVVYLGLIWWTGKTFDSYHDSAKTIAELKDRNRSLQNQMISDDPAKAALEQYFGDLQQKRFPDAYVIVSDARKQERKSGLPPGTDDFLQYVSTFEGTRRYKDFTYEFDRADGEDRRYRVAYDVLNELPRSRIFEARTQTLSSLPGDLNWERLAKIVIDNLNEYYIVPDQAISAIQRYLGSRTVDDLLDPVFLAAMVAYLRNTEKLDIKTNSSRPENKEVWRHFKHDILMIKERGTWKIRSGLNNPVIALYR